MSLIFPSSPESAESSFYVLRPPIEELAYSEINKPGSVVLVKAPHKMGKSSLINWLIAQVKSLNYAVVVIDFKQAEGSVLTDLNKLLRWFCANITRKLSIPSKVENYWDEEIGSKVSCTLYLEGYILENVETPLLLVLNEVDRLFDYPATYREFLPLLRYWYEQAQAVEGFGKLRLVITYSTENYLKLPFNQSPFNVGLSLKLPELTQEQVIDLAKRYGLDWISQENIEKLMEMVGGHPYLLRLAFYYLSKGEITLDTLLREAPTKVGIYKEHLLSLWRTLQQQPELLIALKQVLSEEKGINLEPTLAYKLESLGLVKLDKNREIIRYKLYRLFLESIGGFETENILSEVEELLLENATLKNLVNQDELTQIANRRYFNQFFQTQWREMFKQKKPISLLVIDVDFFKQYNDTYGHQNGDLVLKRIAVAIADVLKNSNYLVARYGGEEFTVLLPDTDANKALFIANTISNKIKSMAMEHKGSMLKLKVITVSCGVASIIPHELNNFDIFFRAADEALYQSKNLGRDTVTVSPFMNYEYQY